MKTKQFTSQQVGKWMAVFKEYDTPEQYSEHLHVIRCMFDAEDDEEFWDEVCEAAKEAYANMRDENRTL